MKSRIVKPAASFQPPETCTEHEECQAGQASPEDLRRNALEHYEKVTSIAHEWSSVVPKAINAYFDSLVPAGKRLCLLCGHNGVSPDGTCLAPVPICSDDYHGTRRCGCRCQFAASLQPPSPQSEEAAKEIVERVFGKQGSSPIYQTAGRLIAELTEKIASALTSAQQRGAELQREVDAKIADAEFAKQYHGVDYGEPDDSVAYRIAAAIRAAKQP